MRTFRDNTFRKPFDEKLFRLFAVFAIFSMVSYDENLKNLIEIFIVFTFAFSSSDAFSISDARLAKEVVAFRHWNINDAGNSPLGLRLFIACESR